MKGKIKYEYKIYNTLTKEYVHKGYAQKATWKRFPKERIDELYNNHEIHKFEYNLIKLTKLNLDGNELN
jgi:hypothetical protein